MTDKLTQENNKEISIRLLKEKAVLLQSAGEERLLKRSDFTEEEVVLIKASFGPWPRCLEAAGLKSPRQDDKQAKIREKRRAAKRRIREQKIKEKSARQDSSEEENAAQK